MEANSRRHILRDGLKLISSGVAGQIVALLLLMLIGRQYDEQAMGVLGTFLGWSGFFATGVMGRYEQAIVVVKDDGEANGLFRLAIELALAGSLIIGGGILLLHLLLPEPPLGTYSWWIAPYVLLLAVSSACSMLSLRKGHYGRLALSQGGRTVGNNLLKVIFGFRQASAEMLLLATALASLVGLAPLLRSAQCAWHAAASRPLRRRLLGRYVNFLRYSTPQALIDTALASLLVLILPFVYSMQEVGLLTMGIMLARRPIQVLSDSLGQVYFERMSRYVSHGQSLWALLRLPLILILCLGGGVAIGLYYWMEELVTLFVGTRWLGSAHIIVWMLPSLLLNFVNAILNVLPDILGRQRLHLYVQIGMLFFELFVIVLGIFLWDFMAFIPFYYGFIFIGQALYLAFLLHLVRRYEMDT